MLCHFVADVQFNLEREVPGIRTFQSELRALSDTDASQVLDQVSWMTAHPMATTVTTGSDVIDIFRPQHHRGVQTVIQEEVTSRVGRGQMLEAAVMTDPQTGRHVTLTDAVTSGLFDVASGGFVDAKTGRRLSLSEAVQLGYIDGEFASQLQRGSGMRDPATGRELTVTEAVQKGYIDVSSGRVIDPRTGKQLSAADAAKHGLLSSDVAGGLSHGEITTKSTSVAHGYYGVSDFPSTQLPALPLHDVVNKDICDAQSGNVVEPLTQRRMSLGEAVKSHVVSASQREVYDPATGDVITVAEAVNRGIIDAQSGRYVDLESQRAIAFDEAVEKKLIQKPLPLHVALTDGLMTAGGQLHGSGSTRLTLMEAIRRGILDTELKCILDTRSSELLSLSEAVERGLINEHGQFVDPQTGSVMPLPAAINEGLAHVVQQDISFADRPLIDSRTGSRLTLTEAIAAGIIDPATGMYIDKRSGRKIPLDEAERSGLIDGGLTDKLLTPTGYRDASGRQMSVLELIKDGLFDPLTGQIVDPRSGRAVSLEDAVSSGLITPSDAALLLKTTSSVIATTTVMSEIQYAGAGDSVSSVEDALRAGLIKNNMYTDPTTGTTMSVNQAVHHGLLQVSSVSDSDTETFAEVPTKRARSEVVPDQSAGIARLSSVNVQRGVDEHQQSEDTEEYTQKIADGTEHVRRRERREFHGRRTEDGGYESVMTQERHVSSLASTRSVAGVSGQPELPMSFSDAIAIGFLNADTGYCKEPATDKEYSVQTALISGLLDPETASFVDPETGRKCGIKTAIDMELLEPTAHYIERQSNEHLTLGNLIDRGIVITQPKEDHGVRDWRKFTIISVVDPKTGLDIEREEARRRGIIDTDRGTYTNTRTGESLSLEDAIDRGLVKVSKISTSGPKSLSESKSYTIVGAIDPDSKKRVDISTALQRGIIDQANGLYLGKDDAGNKFQIPVSEAIKRGLVFTETSGTVAVQEGSRFINTTKTFSVQGVVDPTTGKEISITEAIQRGIVDRNKGLYTDPKTGETMPITEAVNRGLVIAEVRQSTVTASEPGGQASEILVSREVAYTLKSVIDPRTRRELSIAEATSLGILDCATREFHHPVTGEVMSLDDAIARGLVHVELGRPSADQVAESSEERVPSLHIDDEADAREEMTSEELSEERQTFQIAGVVDPDSGDVIPLNEAIENGLVDESGGMYINPKTGERIPISEALERGLIVGQLIHQSEKKQLFRSTVVASRIDDIATVFNPLTGTQIPVSQALQLGLIGRDLVSYYNPATDETMSIDDAVRRGLAIVRSASASKQTATDGVMAVVDWDTGMIVERNTGRQLTPTEALRKGLIDETTARMIDSKQAVKNKTTPTTDQTPVEEVRMTIRTTEVVEQLPSAITIQETISSAERPTEEEFEGQLSFDAAVKLGLFNVKTGQFFNPLSGFVMSLSDAVTSRLINSALPALVDLRTGKVYTLDQAFERQLISVYTGRLDMSRISTANITLDPRLLPDVDWQLQLNVEDAVACRLFDVDSGLVLHPMTHQKLTLSDAVAGGVIAGDVTIVVNLESGARMSLMEALADGFINGQTGQMTLSAGVADNNNARELTLLQAMNYGLIVSCCPPDSTSVMSTETGEKLPIDCAIQRGLIQENAAVVYNPRGRQRVSIKRAMQLGIVDQQSLHFCDPDTRRRIAPVDAARLGLFSLPGAPVLTDVARLALIQSAFETDVATEADARLKEKVTELAAAVLATPADVPTIGATPRKGGDSKTVQSSTETQPMTVTVEDGVLRMTQRTTTTVEKTQTKESTLEPSKQLPRLTDSDTPVTTLQQPGLQQQTPSKVSPGLQMGDFSSAVPQSKMTTSEASVTTAAGDHTVTTMSHSAVGGKAPMIGVDMVTSTPLFSAMDVDSVDDGRSGRRRLPQIPSLTEVSDVTTQRAVVGDGQMMDSRTGEMVPASEALKRGLVEIDWNTGMIKNTRTGEVLAAEEAMRRGLIDSHIKNLIDNRLRRAGSDVPSVITLNDALTTGLLLVPLGRIRNPTTNQRMTVEEAVDIGFLDPDCSLIIDPASRCEITLSEAEKSGLMDFHSGDVKNRATGKTLTLTEMALQGYIPERGLSRSDVMKGASGGAVIDISRSTTTSIKRDTAAQKDRLRTAEESIPFSALSLYEAAERGLIDMDTGYFRHPVTGEVMSLSEAVMRGYVSVPLREGDMDVIGIDFEEAIRRGLIDIRNNTFTEPVTGVLMPLDAAIRNGYVIIPESGIQLRITEQREERLSEMVDECRTVGELCGDEVIQFTRTTATASSVDDVPCGMSLMDAIPILDAETGAFVDPYMQQQMTFAQAVHQGFIEPRSAKVCICHIRLHICCNNCCNKLRG